MYSAEKEDGNAPPPDTGKFIRVGIIAVIAVIIFARAKIMTAITAIIPTLMNFPVSGGGALPSSFSALYKTEFLSLFRTLIPY